MSKFIKVMLALLTCPIFLIGAIYEASALWFKLGKAYVLVDRLNLLNFILSELRTSTPAQGE